MEGFNPLRALVVTGGDTTIAPGDVASRSGDLVIAADEGLQVAMSLGLDADLVVGDMDSVDPGALTAARRSGARIESHPADKEATDLDLALTHARSAGADEIVVIGGLGGRLSHLLGNATLLASDRWEGIRVSWANGPTTVFVCRQGASVSIIGTPGDLVSVIAMSDPAPMVNSSGLRWALEGEALKTGSTRGISNEMTGDTATVSAAAGVALVVHEVGGGL